MLRLTACLSNLSVQADQLAKLGRETALMLERRLILPAGLPNRQFTGLDNP